MRVRHLRQVRCATIWWGPFRNAKICISMSSQKTSFMQTTCSYDTRGTLVIRRVERATERDIKNYHTLNLNFFPYGTFCL